MDKIKGNEFFLWFDSFSNQKKRSILQIDFKLKRCRSVTISLRRLISLDVILNLNSAIWAYLTLVLPSLF